MRKPEPGLDKHSRAIRLRGHIERNPEGAHLVTQVIKVVARAQNGNVPGSRRGELDNVVGRLGGTGQRTEGRCAAQIEVG